MTAPQQKDWAVMTATDQVTVDHTRKAQVAFTVTNLQREASSVTVTVVADDVAASWFTLEHPVRYVERGDSTRYEVTAAVPEDAPPADYSFQLLAYSSDTAPEERPTYSSRVLLCVPAKSVRPRRLKLFLLLLGAILAVVALVTTLVVVLAPEAEEPMAVPSATPSATGMVRVPNVIDETDIEAINAEFARVGLVADIKYFHTEDRFGVDHTDPTPFEEVAPGSTALVYFAVTLKPPTNVRATVTLHSKTLPAHGPVPLRVVADVDLSWEQEETYVQSWLVMFEYCAYTQYAFTDTYYIWRQKTDLITVDIPRLRVIRHYTPQSLQNRYQAFSCFRSGEFVYVYPLDDLGVAGPLAGAQIEVNLSGYSS